MESHLLTYGEVKGWVFGAWGEVSEEIHVLVQRIAKARLEVQDTLPGRRGPATTREARLAALVSRHQLSLLAVQQQSRLILDRLQQLGDGAKEARSRRVGTRVTAGQNSWTLKLTFFYIKAVMMYCEKL